MGKDSKIEWTDHTFNPWVGCAHVSPGCENCYAEALMDQRMGKVEWGPGKPRSRTTDANWRKPRKWNREAALPIFGEARRRPRVFCASLADWLDPEVPIEWLADLLALISATPHLDWLLLTKRPQLWADRMHEVVGMDRDACDGTSLAFGWLHGIAPKNVWIGTTIEDQRRCDERWDQLVAIPAVVRFVSGEPLIGPVQFPAGLPGVHWVICGGESQFGARPMNPAWAQAMRDQCVAARVSFFFKQWGEWVTEDQAPDEIVLPSEGFMAWASQTPDGETYGDERAAFKVGKRRAGRLLDGRTWDEVPRPVLA